MSDQRAHQTHCCQNSEAEGYVIHKRVGMRSKFQIERQDWRLSLLWTVTLWLPFWLVQPVFAALLRGKSPEGTISIQPRVAAGNSAAPSGCPGVGNE
jgi:hypothetical protein